jgi:hypothetical protein
MANLTKTKNHNLFKEEEDQLIIYLYEVFGVKKWETISQFFEQRTPKILHDRYVNHLVPNLKKDKWTIDEDDHLLSFVQKYGKRWVLISKQLPGRSPNSIKERFQKLFLNRNEESLVIPSRNRIRTARLVFPTASRNISKTDECCHTLFLQLLNEDWEKNIDSQKSEIFNDEFQLE